jgi:hypothetical protein
VGAVGVGPQGRKEAGRGVGGADDGRFGRILPIIDARLRQIRVSRRPRLIVAGTSAGRILIGARARRVLVSALTRLIGTKVHGAIPVEARSWLVRLKHRRRRRGGRILPKVRRLWCGGRLRRP